MISLTEPDSHTKTCESLAPFKEDVVEERKKMQREECSRMFKNGNNGELGTKTPTAEREGT